MEEVTAYVFKVPVVKIEQTSQFPYDYTYEQVEEEHAFTKAEIQKLVMDLAKKRNHYKLQYHEKKKKADQRKLATEEGKSTLGENTKKKKTRGVAVKY
jgi:hypothetical protein